MVLVELDWQVLFLPKVVFWISYGLFDASLCPGGPEEPADVVDICVAGGPVRVARVPVVHHNEALPDSTREEAVHQQQHHPVQVQGLALQGTMALMG